MKPLIDMIALRRLAAGVLAALLVVGVACDSEESEAPDKPAQETSADDAPEPAEEPGEEDLAKNREAFGLPLPPQVTTIDRSEQRVRVVTTLSLDELAEFYESRLQDYEILRPPQKIRVLGLREYMPEIYGRRYAGTVRLFYSPNRDGQAGNAAAGDGQDDAAKTDGEEHRAKASVQHTSPIHTRKKGEPVTDRTADGELLAPGARWGEPYTPPPGTPLHKERYKSNWGKPYGEWVAQ